MENAPGRNQMQLKKFGFAILLELSSLRQLSNRQATQIFNILYTLFEFLGVPINPKNVVRPSRTLTFMGIRVDIDAGMISTPHGNCLKILDLCKSFMYKNHVRHKQVQSLLGKRLYVQRCIQPSCIFDNKLPNTLCNYQTKVRVCSKMKKDSISSLMEFNGQVMFSHMWDTLNIHVDASLSGKGAIWGPNVYAV